MTEKTGKVIFESAHQCKICGTQTTQRCTRCTTYYCGRSCQISDWSEHKSLCLATYTRDKKYALCIDLCHEAILGNILIMAAYNPGKVIIVHIDETIEEFSAGTSEHFGHISANLSNSASLGEFDNNVSNESVIYKFKDNNHKRMVSYDKTLFEKIRSKYPAPNELWSVSFRL